MYIIPLFASKIYKAIGVATVCNKFYNVLPNLAYGCTRWVSSRVTS